MTESANWRKQRVQIRRGTTAEWASRNTMLLPGELGYEYDTNRMKVGNGVDRWSSRPYLANQGAISSLSDVEATEPQPGAVLRYADGKWRAYQEENLVDGGNF
jgi:hypothetical protein